MEHTITKEVFDHLVLLASLELTEVEAEYLRNQLNYQLKSIHEMESIPLEGDIPVSTHGIVYSPAIIPEIRKDEWKPFHEVEKILAQAPEIEDGYIVVPEIPHQELK